MFMPLYMFQQEFIAFNHIFYLSTIFYTRNPNFCLSRFSNEKHSQKKNCERSPLSPEVFPSAGVAFVMNVIVRLPAPAKSHKVMSEAVQTCRTYIHTYINTYIHKHIHTYIHTYIHIYMHAYRANKASKATNANKVARQTNNKDTRKQVARRDERSY